jgi:hypothetical protein
MGLIVHLTNAHITQRLQFCKKPTLLLLHNFRFPSHAIQCFEEMISFLIPCTDNAACDVISQERDPVLNPSEDDEIFCC